MTQNVTESVMAEGKCAAPLRALLERRSDVGFIEQLHASLCADWPMEEPAADGGITGPLVADALRQAINAPGLAIRLSERDPRRTDVLQGVAVQAGSGPQADRLLVLVKATIAAGKPPVVENAQADLILDDWDCLDGQCVLAARLEEWWAEYRVRQDAIQQPFPEAPTSCAWLGQPLQRAYRDAPRNWEAKVKALGAILGVRIHIPESPAAAAAWSLQESADMAVIVNGIPGWADIRADLGKREAEVLECGSPGSDFATLLGAVRRSMVSHVLGCVAPDQQAPRRLQPGEIVYHRKASPQPLKFDRFDEGSPDPCQHGAAAFKHWSGDKAVKGMQRRYENFEPRMLYHCSKFPACGVYAVRA